MSRIRTVKPELFRHEDLFDAELESGLPLRLAFIGLFTVADCEGRFRWKPRTLKLDVLPHDTVDFSHVLNALVKYGFIVRYEVGGETFGWIPSFRKHQRLQTKEIEAGSTIPAYQENQEKTEYAPGTIPENSQSRTGTLPDVQEVEVEVEEERKYTNHSLMSCGNNNSARAREAPALPTRHNDVAALIESESQSIPHDWKPSPELVAALEASSIPADFTNGCVDYFRIYHLEANTQRRGFGALFLGWVKSDWKKAQAAKGGAPPQALAANGEPLYQNRQEAKMTVIEWQQYLGRRYNGAQQREPLTLEAKSYAH